jgi:protein TonB
MNTENAVASHQDDVVFDNRNKAYGAYFIRKSYESNLSKGWGTSLLLAAALITVVQIVSMLHPKVKEAITRIPITCGLMPVPDIKPDPQPQKQIHTQPRTNAELSPRAVSIPVADPSPTEIHPSSTVGIDNGPTTEISSQTIGTGEAAQPAVTSTPKIVDIAEIMPEFEGGTKALYKFLQKTLRYPKAAERMGEEGIVFVRFIIDVTGTVTAVEVIKGVGVVLDNEASRVITLMPKWKPGTQHGEPVNVRMVLPIKFQIDKN